MKPSKKLLPLLLASSLLSASPSKGNAQVPDKFFEPPNSSRDVRVEEYKGVYSVYISGKKVYSLSGVSNLKVNVYSRGMVVNNEIVITWKDLEQRVSPSHSNVVRLPLSPISPNKDEAYLAAAAAAAAAATVPAPTSAFAAGGEPTAYDLEKEIIGLAEDKDKDRRISYEEFYPALMRSGAKGEYLTGLKGIKEITMHLKEGGGTPELNGGVILLNVNGNWLKNERGDTVYYKTFTDALVRASWISKEYKSRGKTADIKYWGSISNVPLPEKSGRINEFFLPSDPQQQSLDDRIKNRLSSTYPDESYDKIVQEETRRIKELTGIEKRGGNGGEFKVEYLGLLNLPINKRLASGAFNNLGKVYLREGNYDMAIKVYQKAVELDPSDNHKRNLAIAHKLSS